MPDVLNVTMPSPDNWQIDFDTLSLRHPVKQGITMLFAWIFCTPQVLHIHVNNFPAHSNSIYGILWFPIGKIKKTVASVANHVIIGFSCVWLLFFKLDIRDTDCTVFRISSEFPSQMNPMFVFVLETVTSWTFAGKFKWC